MIVWVPPLKKRKNLKCVVRPVQSFLGFFAGAPWTFASDHGWIVRSLCCSARRCRRHHLNPDHRYSGERQNLRNFINSLFIYQDENEEENENQSFRSLLYVLKQICDERTNNSM